MNRTTQVKYRRHRRAAFGVFLLVSVLALGMAAPAQAAPTPSRIELLLQWWFRPRPTPPPTPTPSPSATPTPTPSATTLKPTVTPTPTVSASGMPVGNLPGLRQVFADDFTTPVAQGQFPASYSSRWISYDGFRDTSKVGLYDQSIISMHDGVMDLNLRTVDGTPRVAAPVPLVNGKWGGQTYGRFEARIKADPLAGYKTAWLLWPDSENWNQGEIDFPEGGLEGAMWGFNHCVNNPSQNCYWLNSKTPYTEWHTVTIDWRPTRLDFLIDGIVVGSTNVNIPTNPMHWVLQTETNGQPAASTNGHLLVDWVTIYTYAP